MFRAFLPENWDAAYQFLLQKPFYNFDLIGKFLEYKENPNALNQLMRVSQHASGTGSKTAASNIGGVLYKSSYILCSFLRADSFSDFAQYISQCSRFLAIQGPYPFMRQLTNEIRYLEKFATVWRHLKILAVHRQAAANFQITDGDFSLQFAKPQHLQQIAIMEQQLYKQEIPSESQPPFSIFLESIYNEIQQKKIYVYEVDGQVVFKLNARTILDYSIIESVFTIPEFRRRGLAKRGMEAICSLLFQQGVRSVFLKANQKNAAAQALYKGLGFEPSGETLSLHFN